VNYPIKIRTESNSQQPEVEELEADHCELSYKDKNLPSPAGRLKAIHKATLRTLENGFL